MRVFSPSRPGQATRGRQSSGSTAPWVQDVAPDALTFRSYSPPPCTGALSSPSHSQQLCNEDLIGLQGVGGKDALDCCHGNCPSHHIYHSKASLAFMYNKLAKRDFQTCGPGFECSLKVLRGIKNACGFCWEITRNRIYGRVIC